MMQAQGVAPDLAAQRDEAFAELAGLEGERIALLSRAAEGDADARKALAALRPRLARQAVLAADLDAAADVRALTPVGCAPGPWDGPGAARSRQARLAALWSERLANAREIERLVGAVAERCRRMDALAQACIDARLAPGPVAAELHRFGDRLRLYVDSMLDFATGLRGLAGDPSYRRLTEVMLDGTTILKLYRQASAGQNESGLPAGT